jgi:hypothetical protein
MPLVTAVTLQAMMAVGGEGSHWQSCCVPQHEFVAA